MGVRMINRKDTQRSVAWRCQFCCSVVLIILYLSFCQNALQRFRRALWEQVDKMMDDKMMNRKRTQRSVAWRCQFCCPVVLIILYLSFCQNALPRLRRALWEQVDKMMGDKMMNRKRTQRSVAWRCQSCCPVILIILYSSFSQNALPRLRRTY
jgi:hypothetical protein